MVVTTRYFAENLYAKPVDDKVIVQLGGRYLLGGTRANSSVSLHIQIRYISVK